MRRIIIALTIAQALCVANAYAADKTPTKPKIIAKDKLPGLKGGKQRKYTDGIPGCTKGRAVVEGDTMEEWASDHPDHACAMARTMYVCRAGKNLSVRCEDK